MLAMARSACHHGQYGGAAGRSSSAEVLNRHAHSDLAYLRTDSALLRISDLGRLLPPMPSRRHPGAVQCTDVQRRRPAFGADPADRRA